MLNGHVPVGTKRCVPRLSPLLVPRPRLEALLDDGTRPQVTLVGGPPGAGKPTLVASALDPLATSRMVSWLSLDERDNDPGRLVTLLCSALDPGDGVRSGPIPGPGPDHINGNGHGDGR